MSLLRARQPRLLEGKPAPGERDDVRDAVEADPGHARQTWRAESGQ